MRKSQFSSVIIAAFLATQSACVADVAEENDAYDAESGEAQSDSDTTLEKRRTAACGATVKVFAVDGNITTTLAEFTMRSQARAPFIGRATRRATGRIHKCLEDWKALRFKGFADAPLGVTGGGCEGVTSEHRYDYEDTVGSAKGTIFVRAKIHSPNHDGRWEHDCDREVVLSDPPSTPWF